MTTSRQPQNRPTLRPLLRLSDHNRRPQPLILPSPSRPAFETNPAVRSALEMPRKEPRDYVQAILWLVDLGRPELAKPILADLAKLQSDRRSADRDRHRVWLARHAYSSRTEGAATGRRPRSPTPAWPPPTPPPNNPQRIAALIKQLTDPSLEVRTIARNDLAATGQLGATATLEAIARETDPQRRAAMLAAIELMHPLVDGPLLAMLDTNDPQLRADVATSSTDFEFRKPQRSSPPTRPPPNERSPLRSRTTNTARPPSRR